MRVKSEEFRKISIKPEQHGDGLPELEDFETALASTILSEKHIELRPLHIHHALFVFAAN